MIIYVDNHVISYKYALIIILMYFNSATLLCQSNVDFPNSWVGKWKGDMQIYAGPILTQTLPMQLHIMPTDSSNTFTYRIIYGQDTVAGDRPYLIKVIDAKKGRYLIDEQNSIKIEAFLLGNQLTSCFEVQGNMIFDILEKRGDTLYWRLISGGMKTISTTGNTTYNNEVIPAVNTYPMRILQSAELKR